MRHIPALSFAATAVLTLALLAGATATPALAAEDNVQFVCYDMPNPDPNEGLVCMTLGDFKAECEAGSGLEECDLVEADGETVVIGGLLRDRPMQSLMGASDGGGPALAAPSGNSRLSRF